MRTRTRRATYSPVRRDLPLLITLTLLSGAVYLIYCIANGPITSVTEFPLDDAWIHQVYARGTLADGVPTYNDGIPETGFSSLLWLTALLPVQAVSAAAGISPVGLTKLVGLLFAVLAAWGIGVLSDRLGAGRVGRWIAAGFALLTPGFAFSSVSGMEVTLASAALVWGFVAFHDERFGWAGLALALAGLARPEIGLATVILGVMAASGPGRSGRGGRLARLLAPSALLGGAWVVYCLAVTGHPLPNTFYVKTGGGELAERIAYYVEYVLLDPGWPIALATGALMLVGLMGAWGDSRTRRLALGLIAVQSAILLSVTLAYPLKDDVYFYLQRYYYPFTILDWALVAVGVTRLAGRLAPGAARRLGVAATVAVLAALLVPPTLSLRTRYADNCRDIFVLHTMPGREIAQNTPDDMVVAVEGAGGARYHGERFTVDLLGLNHQLMAHAESFEERICIVVGHQPQLLVIP